MLLNSPFGWRKWMKKWLKKRKSLKVHSLKSRNWSPKEIKSQKINLNSKSDTLFRNIFTIKFLRIYSMTRLTTHWFKTLCAF